VSIGLSWQIQVRTILLASLESPTAFEGFSIAFMSSSMKNGRPVVLHVMSSPVDRRFVPCTCNSKSTKEICSCLIVPKLFSVGLEAAW